MPAVGVKICVFCVTLGLNARDEHSSKKDCVTVYGSILMRLSVLFSEWVVLSDILIILIFIARWCHNFREIAVKNFEKSKNRRKSVCVPLRIDSREI